MAGLKDRSSLRTWREVRVLPCLGGQDWDPPYQDGRGWVLPWRDDLERDLPCRGDPGWDLPCCDGLDWGHCVPCRGSGGRPCRGERRGPWGCYQGERTVPWGHCPLTGSRG